MKENERKGNKLIKEKVIYNCKNNLHYMYIFFHSIKKFDFFGCVSKVQLCFCNNSGDIPETLKPSVVINMVSLLIGLKIIVFSV